MVEPRREKKHCQLVLLVLIHLGVRWRIVLPSCLVACVRELPRARADVKRANPQVSYHFS